MDERQKTSRVHIAGVVVALLVVFLIGALLQAPRELWEVASQEETEEAYAYTPPAGSRFHFTEGIERWYTSERLGFSFRLPEGLSAPDGKLLSSETYVVTLTDHKETELIVSATRMPERAGQTLSEAMVRASVQEGAVTNVRSASLREGTEGLLFEHGSGEGEGSDVAFWCIHDGYLYRLETKTKNADLLTLVMETWRFGLPVQPIPQ